MSFRKICYEALLSCLSKKEPLTLPRVDLKPEEIARTKSLADAVLRHYGELEATAKSAMDKPIQNPLKVKLVLLQGLAEIFYLKTPAHAVLNETVELAPPRYRGFINAILRRASRGELPPIQDPLLNLPLWIMKSWQKEYGDEKTALCAQALNSVPPLDLSIKADHEAPSGGTLTPSGTVRYDDLPRMTTLESYKNGEWWVQDLAAALPIKLFSQLQGKRVLDMCAAPGGKTFQLVDAGAQVTALDASARRIETLTENLARLKLAANVIHAQGQSWQTDTLFDAILLDAPCSATGSAHRQPDVLRIKGPGEVTRQVETQSALLENALTLLKPGGELIYCVCSLEPQEGADQIKAFLKRHKGKIERMPITADEFFGLSEAIIGNGDVILLPSVRLSTWGVIGGFFISRLRKI